MSHPEAWIWILVPLLAIGIAPFKMWLRVKEKQIESQSNLAAENRPSTCVSVSWPSSAGFT